MVLKILIKTSRELASGNILWSVIKVITTLELIMAKITYRLFLLIQISITFFRLVCL